jgi:hypothetical protein
MMVEKGTGEKFWARFNTTTTKDRSKLGRFVFVMRRKKKQKQQN